MPPATATSPQKKAIPSSCGRFGKERGVSQRNERSTGHLDGGVKMGRQGSVSPGVDSRDPRSTQGRGERTRRAHEMSDGDNVSTPESKPLESGHVPVNGINMYYEVHGRHGRRSARPASRRWIHHRGHVRQRAAGLGRPPSGHRAGGAGARPHDRSQCARHVRVLGGRCRGPPSAPEGRPGGHLWVQQRRERRPAGRHPTPGAGAKDGLCFIDDQASRGSTAILGVHEAGGLLEHAAAAQGRLPEGEPGRAAAQDHARQGRRNECRASRTYRTTRYGPSARRR